MHDDFFWYQFLGVIRILSASSLQIKHLFYFFFFVVEAFNATNGRDLIKRNGYILQLTPRGPDQGPEPL